MKAQLTLIGHASVKIRTENGKVIYIDPYYDGDYSEAADLVLITHEHQDHNRLDLITLKENGRVYRLRNSIHPDGSYGSMEHEGILAEAVPARNRNHPAGTVTGFLVSFDGITVYHAADTSLIEEMKHLAPRNIDYALYPIDGKYNMDADEAGSAATLVGARHNIPIHHGQADPRAFRPARTLYLRYGDTIDLSRG